MKLIILLLALGLERYLGLGEKLRRFSWFDNYLQRLHGALGKQSWFQGFAGAILTIAPIPVIITLIACLLIRVMGEMQVLMALVLNVLVLLYCLGPKNIYHQIQAYIPTNAQAAAESTATIEHQTLDGAHITESHAMTKAIFWQANQQMFGVLFWFMLLGMFGALFYRVTALLRQSSNEPTSPFTNQYLAAQQIQNILDWMPVRLFTLFFALVGQFNATFTYWLENIVTGLANCRKFISEAGLIALGGVKSEKASLLHTPTEYHSALSLIDRALIIFLAIVALFTLGSWLY